MSKLPPELYLQTHDDDGDEVGEITFCYDNVYRCDTRYVRGDIADDLLAALKMFRHDDGCYCESAFAGPGTIVSHTPECRAAMAATAKAMLGADN